MNKKWIITGVILVTVIVLFIVLLIVIGSKKNNVQNDVSEEVSKSEFLDENLDNNKIDEKTNKTNIETKENIVENNTTNTNNNEEKNNTINNVENNDTEVIKKQKEEKTESKTNVPNYYNLDESVFLLDFDNYNPGNNETKISEVKAKQIAQKGFDESKKRIAGEGADDTASEKVKVDQISPNNYFTRYGREYDKTYTNIKRKCYIISRENDMGNGIRIYVDASTGLIIGGTAYGD